MRRLTFCLMAAVAALGTSTVEAHVTLPATKDSYLLGGTLHSNQGEAFFLRVGGSLPYRVVVAFDLSGVDLSALTRARLVLTISTLEYPSQGWGTGRPVRAHRLLSDWTEGNGWRSSTNNLLSTIPGVTWECATDDFTASGCAMPWNGGTFAEATAPAMMHTDGMTGEVEWDVTEDVRAGAPFGWLVKAENEGEGAIAGYHSRESAASADNALLAPRLILEGLGPNRPPVAATDQGFASQGTPATLRVLANDFDPDNDPMTLVAVGEPSHGTAVIEGKEIRYSSSPDFVGTASFPYTVRDSHGAESTGTALVTVGVPTSRTLPAVKDSHLRLRSREHNLGGSALLNVSLEERAIVGFDLTPVGAEGLVKAWLVLSANEVVSGATGLEVRAYRLLSDWTEGSGATGSGVTWSCATDLNVSNSAADCETKWNGGTFAASTAPIVVHTTGTAGGEVIFDVTEDVREGAPFGWVIKKIYERWSGSVKYVSREGGAAGPRLALETIDIDVGPENQAPVAVPDSATLFESASVAIQALENDRDPDGDILTILSVTAPSQGTASLLGETVTYAPALGFAGRDSFRYTLGDGRGGLSEGTVSVRVLPDDVPPSIEAVVGPEPNASGWHAGDATVSFVCRDDESGLLSCPDAVVVSAEGEAQEVRAAASDRAGNTAEAVVRVSLDRSAPSVALAGPASARAGERVKLRAEASDNLGLASVHFLADGGLLEEREKAPFEASFVIPVAAVEGALLSLEAVALDEAGNQTTATQVLSVTGGGFVQGEVYDDSRGVPLPEVSVFVGSQTLATDFLGRFAAATASAAPTVVRFSKEGFTSVERFVEVDPLRGTVVPDARLTPLDPAGFVSIDSGGGAIAAGPVRLELPAGAVAATTSLRMTPISGQGLKAPLPLGWSPLASVEIEPDLGLAVGAELQLENAPSNAVLARYDEAAHAWIARESPISRTGTYAFVLADEEVASAIEGEPLPAAEPVTVAFGLTATAAVTPEASPVSPEARATGTVTLSSVVSLPSGTRIAARVEESFETHEEGSIRPEPFTQELALYRMATGDLAASFPVTPTRSYTAEELREGKVHVDLSTAPERYRGTLVSPGARLIEGDGGVSLSIPAGALTTTIAASVEPLEDFRSRFRVRRVSRSRWRRGGPGRLRARASGNAFDPDFARERREPLCRAHSLRRGTEEAAPRRSCNPRGRRDPRLGCLGRRRVPRLPVGSRARRRRRDGA